ncbi:MAG: peptidylprolyl isomerase [Aulosira sp. ZfuVER01]|nr:peptidylprolyl isomerase [Aulosira sp. ZfuVER01]MDZ8002900.1 peptidylprolyl isomerase [Aulosira sp. DedVER01a]MDZ8053587.1 peptidylprolyl isomerase [Aulosira sp. ZfuCHP01]
MTTVLQIANKQLTGEELISCLNRSHLLPQVLREVIIEQAIASIDYTLDELHSFCQQLQQANQTQVNFQHDLEASVVRQLKIHKFQKANWGDRVESYFLSQKHRLERASFSLIQISDGRMAQEIYFRLTENEHSFAELAKQYSQGLEAQNGGWVGTLKLSYLHPKLSEILRTSQPGEISPIVYLEKMFFIVRLEQFIPAQLNAQMRQELLQEMFDNWLQEQIIQYKDAVCLDTFSESHIVVQNTEELPSKSAETKLEFGKNAILNTVPNLPEANFLGNLKSEKPKTRSISLFYQSQKTKFAAALLLCLLIGGFGGFYLSTHNLPLSYATLVPAVSKTNTFHTAINLATQAANLSQIAQSLAEWEQVTQTWKSAIALLKSLPKTHPHYTLAAHKINEYERNLNYAHQYTQNRFHLAVNYATTAANLTQAASKSEDWKVVIKHWQGAIALMKSVQLNSPKYSVAKQKTIEYQHNLNYAQANILNH